ncbi:MAG TPA: hypothetical protein H9673_03490 [Candidatus Adamsella sp.]|nr:hypothetical protein [Candidatus Adamsella sp.]
MNKTDSYTTGYFAYAQYDPPSFCGAHPRRLFAFAQSDGENALHPPCQILLKPVILPDFL